ncbi:MAG TPA: hypothetical protein VMR74_12870 [Gammaproteobacteria bacterium]|nr:hypothetical protein [Gammaproteobacteria bacterium]
MRSTTIALAALAAAAALAATESQAQRRDFEGGAPAPGPAPVNESGRVLLDGLTADTVGVWTPMFGISDPVAPIETVPFQPWAAALYEDRQAHELEPHARCKASGASRQFLTPYGVEIVEIPELERLFIFDIGGPHTFRTVYMDGRSHPVDLEPTNYGHSVGWWEGDTLVIDTVGYNEDFWFERRGLPHTEALHTIERLTRVDERQVTYEIEIHDPNVYTAPYTGGFNLRWNEGTELFEYICQQANYAHELMVGSEQDSVDRSSTIIP